MDFSVVCKYWNHISSLLSVTALTCITCITPCSFKVTVAIGVMADIGGMVVIGVVVVTTSVVMMVAVDTVLSSLAFTFSCTALMCLFKLYLDVVS